MSTPTYPVATIAKLFNLSERRVQQLANDGIIPKPVKGKYELVPSVMGYIKYLQERASGREILSTDAHLERARLLKAQADKTELEVKAMNGELIAAEQVEILWSGLVSAFRSRMLGLPVRCANLVMSMDSYQEIEGCLRSHIYEALEELSHYDPEQGGIDIEESGEPIVPSAVLEDQPVGGSVSPA